MQRQSQAVIKRSPSVLDQSWFKQQSDVYNLQVFLSPKPSDAFYCSLSFSKALTQSQRSHPLLTRNLLLLFFSVLCHLYMISLL